LRVLFLTQTFPRWPHDGSGPFIRDLARGMVRAGHRVRVLAPHARGIPVERVVDGVGVRSFRYAPQGLELVGYGRSLVADESLRIGSAIAAPLYLVGAWNALRRELGAASWDLVHAHWVAPNALVGARFAHRVPLAVGLHGSDVFMAEKRIFRPWIRRALARTSVLTSCSPELARRVEAIGFDPAHTRVIPYGVDVDLFHPDPASTGGWRERLGIPADSVVALSVGRMATKKGFQVLMGALGELFARCPELHLVLAGGGDRLEEFRRVSSPWRDQVHLPGAIEHDTLPDLYRAADLFVLPAVHDSSGNVDGLPNVILEAMASGLPVVASEVSGVPLAVRDGSEGRLVAEGDAAGLVAAISDLVERRDERRRMGAAARTRAERELTWDAVAGRYLDAYELALTRAR